MMRVPVYLVCAALVVAVTRSEEQNSNFYNNDPGSGRFLEPLDVSADQETVSYLLPKLAAKYRPDSEWSGVTDPRFYVLTEMESNNIDNQMYRHPRNLQRRSPSMSITANIDVLRQKYMQEIQRKQMERNRQFLNGLP